MTMRVSSELNYLIKDEFLTAELGEPLQLVIKFNPVKSSFHSVINGDELGSYVVSYDGEIFFGEVTLTGNLQTTYLGFPLIGERYLQF